MFALRLFIRYVLKDLDVHVVCFPRYVDTEDFRCRRRRRTSTAGDGHKISQCECKSDFGEKRVILTDSLSGC